MVIIYIYILCINIYESKKKILIFCSKMYMKIYRRIKYEDIIDFIFVEGREILYFI